MVLRSCIKIVLFLSVIISVVYCADWPQLQRDSQRTGRTTDTVLPNYRPRWIWFGTAGLIRNHLSNSGWTGPDIAPGEIVADKTTLPSSVPFTFADCIQPVIVNGKIYVGDMDGKVYAIDGNDGATLWTADNPGGTIVTACYANSVIVFASVTGKIRGYNADTGNLIWEVSTKGPITSAPATNGTVVCVGTHEGRVYCINAGDGNKLWTSPYLGAQIAGGVAIDGDTVYTGAENMIFYALRLSDGSIKLSKKVTGQSFYQSWPVVYSSYVFVEATPVPIIGSEFTMEEVMRDSTDFDNEQDNILRWLSGDTNGGAWPDAVKEWKHFTVLKKSDFTEPFTVPVGPFEGCGAPPEPPVVDNQGRVLTYFRTKFPRLVSTVPFGTAYPVDICGINLATGRKEFPTGTLVPVFPYDVDNLFGFTVGGDILYMRQSFRGTQCVNLSTRVHRFIQAAVFNRDAAQWYADVLYVNTGGLPSTSRRSIDSARTAPSISGNILYFTETYCVIAVEHHQ